MQKWRFRIIFVIFFLWIRFLSTRFNYGCIMTQIKLLINFFLNIIRLMNSLIRHTTSIVKNYDFLTVMNYEFLTVTNLNSWLLWTMNFWLLWTMSNTVTDYVEDCSTVAPMNSRILLHLWIVKYCYGLSGILLLLLK